MFLRFDYLFAKRGFESPEMLRHRIIEKCEQLDMKEMAQDVSPFLFNAKNEKKVLLFSKYMEQVNLS